MKNQIILYTIILQAVTAIFVFISPSPIQVARLGIFYNIFPSPQIGALIMAIGVVMTLHGISIRDRSPYYILFFVPQLFFLLLTTGSALVYVVLQHYADGVLRPWPFIFIDQLPSFVATALYPFAIFDFRKEKDGSEIIKQRNTTNKYRIDNLSVRGA